MSELPAEIKEYYDLSSCTTMGVKVKARYFSEFKTTEDLKEIIQTGDKETLQTKSKDLSDTMLKIGQHMYQDPAEDTPKGESPKGEKDEKPDNDAPVEGEIVED